MPSSKKSLLLKIVRSMNEYGQLEHETEVRVAGVLKGFPPRPDAVSIQLVDEDGGPTYTLTWAGYLDKRPLVRIAGPATNVLVSAIPKFILAVLMEA